MNTFLIFFWVFWFYSMIRLSFVDRFLDRVLMDALDYDIRDFDVCHPVAKRITGKYIDFCPGFLKLVYIPKPLKYKYWFSEEDVYFLEHHKIKSKQQ